MYHEREEVGQGTYCLFDCRDLQELEAAEVYGKRLKTKSQEVFVTMSYDVACANGTVRTPDGQRPLSSAEGDLRAGRYCSIRDMRQKCKQYTPRHTSCATHFPRVALNGYGPMLAQGSRPGTGHLFRVLKTDCPNHAVILLMHHAPASPQTEDFDHIPQAVSYPHPTAFSDAGSASEKGAPKKKAAGQFVFQP